MSAEKKKHSGPKHGGPRRVVITGMGTVNALGLDVASTLEAFREGRCGITQLDFRDVDRLTIQIDQKFVMPVFLLSGLAPDGPRRPPRDHHLI